VKELSVQPLPQLLYALPTDIKRASTLLTFKKKLKTFLFSKHLFCDFTVFYYSLLVHIGGLSRLHSADEDAVSWLTSYGS